ncbi:MAG: hypothetical protein WD004_05860 [Actinomycetota bacterium]
MWSGRSAATTAIVAGLILSGCSFTVWPSSTENTASPHERITCRTDALPNFECWGISLRAPAGWKPVPPAGGEGDTHPVFRENIGVDSFNALDIAAFRLLRSVDDPTSVEQIGRDFEQLFHQLIESQGGDVLSFERSDIDGNPAWRAEGTLTASGHRMEGTVLFVVNGNQQYSIACLYEISRRQRSRDLCEQALRSTSVST